MTIGPHRHSCDDCGQLVECCGAMRQLGDHENRFACTEYERCDDYRCEACRQKREANEYHELSLDESVQSLQDVAQRIWQASR